MGTYNEITLFKADVGGVFVFKNIHSSKHKFNMQRVIYVMPNKLCQILHNKTPGQA